MLLPSTLPAFSSQWVNRPPGSRRRRWRRCGGELEACAGCGSDIGTPRSLLASSPLDARLVRGSGLYVIRTCTRSQVCMDCCWPSGPVGRVAVGGIRASHLPSGWGRGVLCWPGWRQPSPRRARAPSANVIIAAAMLAGGSAALPCSATAVTMLAVVPDYLLGGHQPLPRVAWGAKQSARWPVVCSPPSPGPGHHARRRRSHRRHHDRAPRWRHRGTSTNS